MSSVRILVVEDFEPFRQFIRITLHNRRGMRIVSEVSDGFVAVEQAHELRPDLVLLDIGLPTLNGLETGRQIRKVSPKSNSVYESGEGGRCGAGSAQIRGIGLRRKSRCAK
jgi:DNA-binding NarL/FixJ family response regulator